MLYWSFTSLVHFGHPQFLILATPMSTSAWKCIKVPGTTFKGLGIWHPKDLWLFFCTVRWVTSSLTSVRLHLSVNKLNNMSTVHEANMSRITTTDTNVLLLKWRIRSRFGMWSNVAVLSVKLITENRHPVIEVTPLLSPWSPDGVWAWGKALGENLWQI